MSIGVLVDIGKSLTSFKSETVSIDLDVTQDEVHEWTNDVTTNPVETGAPISDHIQPLPDRITVTGMISDSSISDAVIKQYSGVDDTQFLTRVQTTFDLLYKIKTDRKLVTVYTKHKIYTDMAISSINIPRSTGTGDAVNFTIEFMHVRMVNTQTVEMPKGISKGNAKRGKSVQRKTQAAKNKPKTDAKDITSEDEKVTPSVFVIGAEASAKAAKEAKKVIKNAVKIYFPSE